jgi:hypothetical protein
MLLKWASQSNGEDVVVRVVLVKVKVDVDVEPLVVQPRMTSWQHHSAFSSLQ